ncbi:MAG: hypothetical protein GKR93_04855 [Gammaproteobacteria bacterium]|nr:hypothetical protein [Gammaproteobacteria bacterium]
MKSSQKLRQEIAAAAAKIVALDGVEDFLSAKKKAAIQLGVSPNRNLPTNQEIENALITYQDLFLPDRKFELLQSFRQTAMQAMKMLVDYKPQLVGPVVNQTVTASSEIILHLFSDNIEEIGLFLDECGIPNEICEKNIKLSATDKASFPAYRFIADQISILLIIFSLNDKNLSPVSSITNKPMHVMNLTELEDAIEKDRRSLEH